MKFISNFNVYIKENYLKYFNINSNRYWFEVRDPKNDKGYSVGWGVGNIEDDNFSKFDRTDRHEQFLIFSEVKKLFKEWFHRVKPDNFYFSVPGEKRLRIYMNYLEDIIGKDYTSEVVETEYKPFDRKETKVYYGVFKKNKVFEADLSREEREQMIRDASKKQNKNLEMVNHPVEDLIDSLYFIFDKYDIKEYQYDNKFRELSWRRVVRSRSGQIEYDENGRSYHSLIPSDRVIVQIDVYDADIMAKITYDIFESKKVIEKRIGKEIIIEKIVLSSLKIEIKK